MPDPPPDTDLGTDLDADLDADLDTVVDAALHASRALLGAVTRSLAGALEQVTLPQFRVLVLLAGRGPQRSGDLARAIGVHPSTFSRSADRLIAGGWAVRAGNPDSRREVLVELTPAGAGLVAEVTARRRAELREVLARLGPEEAAAVRDALRAYADAAGEVSPDPLGPGL
ncbi:MarR family transcriptional regulator [Klenkia sp. LSe6-5]|uniref:MarR family transcriptional regulator n=1 Tax=Klenkia sesuvii TaxID=3103137 RepID=A0ABU8DWK3_9ACTN